MAGGAELHVAAEQALRLAPERAGAMRQRQLREMPAGPADIAEGGDGGARSDTVAFDQRDLQAAPSQEEGCGSPHQAAAEHDHIHVQPLAAKAAMSTPPNLTRAHGTVKDAMAGRP